MAVIRAYGAGGLFQAKLLDSAETNISMFTSLWSANRWLSMRFVSLSAVAIGGTACVALLRLPLTHTASRWSLHHS